MNDTNRNNGTTFLVCRLPVYRKHVGRPMCDAIAQSHNVYFISAGNFGRSFISGTAATTTIATDDQYESRQSSAPSHTMFCGDVTWRYIERPTQHGIRHWNRRNRFAMLTTKFKISFHFSFEFDRGAKCAAKSKCVDRRNKKWWSEKKRRKCAPN